MTFKDFFDINGSINKPQRTLNVTVRLLGVDFDLALYGWVNDWSVITLLTPPQVLGVAVQVLGLALFVGRLLEVPEPSVASYSVPAKVYGEDGDE